MISINYRLDKNRNKSLHVTGYKFASNFFSFNILCNKGLADWVKNKPQSKTPELLCSKEISPKEAFIEYHHFVKIKKCNSIIQQKSLDKNIEAL